MYLWVYCLFLVGMLVISTFHSHYMLVLLGLEMSMLAIFLFFCCFYLSSLGYPGSFLFLMIMVCMGGFRVSLLVYVSRSRGRDFWGFSFLL